MDYEKYTTEITYQGHTIPVEVRPTWAKNMSMSVCDGVIEVLAPEELSRSKVTEFINAHIRWAWKRLALENQKAAYKGTLSILGVRYVVNKVEGKPEVVLGDGVITISALDGDYLSVLESWWTARAQEYFSRETARIFDKWKTELRRTKVPAVQTVYVGGYWGKCLRDRNLIKYNAAMYQAEPQVIEEIICHELTHLRYSGHQKDFYDCFLKIFPRARDTRKQLKLYNTDFLRV